MPLVSGFILAFSSLVFFCSGNAFLEQTISRRGQLESVDQASVEHRLLAEVHVFTGRGQADLQLPAIRKQLEPMWQSLPKNAQGNLGHFEARYALHRLFVQRHGWQLDGLGSSGDVDGGKLANGLMRGRVPSFLMERFEEAFGTSGLKLDELAIFAATLEHIIHDEATSRLHHLYSLLDMTSMDTLNTQTALHILESFAVTLIRGSKPVISQRNLQQLLLRIGTEYPGWADTKLWVSDLFFSTSYLEQTRTNPFVTRSAWTFEQIERVAQKISHGFGRFQNTDCDRLKNDLVEVEDGFTGRVRISAFYERFLETKSAFRETPESLRKMGALEDRGNEPRIIISNYVLAPSNCLADTGFYSICCINECEAVMAEVERAVAAPHATPEDIIAVISQVSTTSSERYGELPLELVQRLMLIAARHDGQVPLHGRLFAQWLHAAFPRECPYPHISSKVNTSSAAEYSALAVKKFERSSIEEFVANAAVAPAENGTQGEVILEWHKDEELLYKAGEKPRISTSWGTSLPRVFFTIVGVAAFLAAVADRAKRWFPANLGESGKVHLV